MAAYSLTATAVVRHNSDGAFIPPDINNKDRQIYTAWLASGGVADPYAPLPASPQQQYNDVQAAGVNTTWTVSSGPDGSLNGVYAIDQQSLFNITAETVTILSSGMFSTGGTSRYWLNQAGTPMAMNLAQFKAFAMAVSGYVDSLYAVVAARQAGQVNTPWPSSTVTINA